MFKSSSCIKLRVNEAMPSKQGPSKQGPSNQGQSIRANQARPIKQGQGRRKPIKQGQPRSDNQARANQAWRSNHGRAMIINHAGFASFLTWSARVSALCFVSHLKTHSAYKWMRSLWHAYATNTSTQLHATATQVLHNCWPTTQLLHNFYTILTLAL